LKSSIENLDKKSIVIANHSITGKNDSFWQTPDLYQLKKEM